MLSERMQSLMRAAADALDDGQVPLSPSFLETHQVTLEEAHILAEMMSAIIRAFLKMSLRHQAATFVAGASEPIEIAPVTLAALSDDARAKLGK